MIRDKELNYLEIKEKYYKLVSEYEDLEISYNKLKQEEEKNLKYTHELELMINSKTKKDIADKKIFLESLNAIEANTKICLRRFNNDKN